MTASPFVPMYLRSVMELLDTLPCASIEKAADMLLEAHASEANVFIAGNGGSAALASHLACDLEKTLAGPRFRRSKRRLRAVSLCDNLATLTAWANDEGYEHVFSERLRAHANPGDVLIVISASGNSPNILEALRAGDELGLRTIAWLGFDGGQAMRMAECSIHVPVHDYGIVEGVHGIISHLITDLCSHSLRVNRASLRPAGPVLVPAGGVK